MSQPTRDARRSLQIRAGWERTVSEYYELCQITFDTEFVFNTGVLVFQPRKHADFCRDIYNKYKHNQLIHPRGFHYEQAAVNYEYQKKNKLIPIPSEWNSLGNIHKFAGYEGTLADFMKEKHFAHLAGGFDHQAARAWTSGRIW